MTLIFVSGWLLAVQTQVWQACYSDYREAKIYTAVQADPVNPAIFHIAPMLAVIIVAIYKQTGSCKLLEPANPRGEGEGWEKMTHKVKSSHKSLPTWLDFAKPSLDLTMTLKLLWLDLICFITCLDTEDWAHLNLNWTEIMKISFQMRHNLLCKLDN